MGQLALKLTPEVKQTQVTDHTWHVIDQSHKGLKVTKGDNILFWGYWDQLFGVWGYTPNGHDLGTETILSENILSSKGMFSWGEAGKVNPGTINQCPYITDYFSRIPLPLRRLISPTGKDQWLSLDLVKQQPDFASFLESNFHHDNSSYLKACFRISRLNQRSRQERYDFAFHMMSTKRHQLIGELLGMNCPKSFLNLLCKITGPDLEPRDYHLLLSFQYHKNIWSTLNHIQALHGTALKLLHKLPVSWLSPSLFQLMTGSEKDITYTLGYFFTLQACPKEYRERAIQSFNLVYSDYSFKKWYQKWQGMVNEDSFFPAPPFPTGACMTAITTRDELFNLAIEMQNCVLDYLPSILRGTCYFYRWETDFTATVMLKKYSYNEWILEDVLGPKNTTLSLIQRKQIEDFWHLSF